MAKIVAYHVSKKNIPKIKKELKEQGYKGLKAMKSGKWYNIYYTSFKKPIAKTKNILVNFDDIKSIKKAEKMKSKLENQGYKLVKTIQRGLNKFMLVYEEKIRWLNSTLKRK